jgi:hypothetical protein
MRSRCKNPAKIHYHGKGIRVCKRWNLFENFLSDMGERPDGMTLDRIDSSGDYEPNNCRWATPKEQSRTAGWFGPHPKVKPRRGEKLPRH